MLLIPTNIPVSKESFPMPDAVWCSVNISVSPYPPLPSKEEKGGPASVENFGFN